MLRFSHELFTAGPVVAGIGRHRSYNKLHFKSARVFWKSVLLTSICYVHTHLTHTFSRWFLKTSRDWEISPCPCVGSRCCITVKCSVACNLFPAVLVIHIYFYSDGRYVRTVSGLVCTYVPMFWAIFIYMYIFTCRFRGFWIIYMKTRWLQVPLTISMHTGISVFNYLQRFAFVRQTLVIFVKKKIMPVYRLHSVLCT